MKYPYYFAWKSSFDGQGNPTRWPSLHRKHFRVLLRDGMNKALVEWEDGTQDVILRNAIRKRKG